MKSIRLIAVAIILANVSCAYFIAGHMQEVRIESTPQKARVTARCSVANWWGSEEETKHGNTPCTMELDKSMQYTITIALDGYRDAQVELGYSLKSTWYLWAIPDVLMFGVPLWVDWSSHALHNFKPDRITVSLETALDTKGISQTVAVVDCFSRDRLAMRQRIPLIPAESGAAQ
jgi:hypothetical protein